LSHLQLSLQDPAFVSSSRHIDTAHAAHMGLAGIKSNHVPLIYLFEITYSAQYLACYLEHAVLMAMILCCNIHAQCEYLYLTKHQFQDIIVHTDDQGIKPKGRANLN
jgi:hypothetical protein